MMYPYDYGYSYVYVDYGKIMAVAALVATILAVVLYFTFMSSKNEGKYKGAMKKIYNFLNFNKFYTEEILKLVYVVSAAVITVVGVIMLFRAFLMGLIMLTLGNVVLRVAYELLMMFIIMCRKTVSIDRRLAMAQKSAEPEPSEAFGAFEGQSAPQASEEPGEQAAPQASEAPKAEDSGAAAPEAGAEGAGPETEDDDAGNEDVEEEEEEIISTVYGSTTER